MRTFKSFTSLLIVLVMLCSLGMVSVGAQAESDSNYTFKDNSDFLQEYRPIQDGLKVYCAKQEYFPAASAFEAMMGGANVEVVSLESAKDEPVTYYCLVDVSGSINRMQLLMAKQMLNGLCDSLGKGDQMLIATVAREIKSSGYLKDAGTIRTKIEEITTTTEDTNLYRAITDCLETLNTSTETENTRKCLVLFSDGMDDITAATGRTREEAEKKIDDTRIPIYCMLPPSSEKDAGKTLGSFARRSVGGEAYYLSGSELTEQQIGESIAADMKGDMILRLDLTGFQPKEDEFLLAVGYKDTTGATYGDSLRIISKVLMLTRLPEKTAEPAPILPDPVPQPPSWKRWVKIAAVVLCAALAVLIVYMLWKKKKDSQESEEKDMHIQTEGLDQNIPNVNACAGDGGNDTVQVDEEINWDSRPLPPTRPIDNRGAAKAGKTIRFTTVGSKSFTQEITLQEGKQTTVGRTRKADEILNESDTRLSGVHFALMLKDNKLYIADAGSTNGTAVNGIPLKGSGIEIKNGETVSAGSYQYRVQF